MIGHNGKFTDTELYNVFSSLINIDYRTFKFRSDCIYDPDIKIDAKLSYINDGTEYLSAQTYLYSLKYKQKRVVTAICRKINLMDFVEDIGKDLAEACYNDPSIKSSKKAEEYIENNFNFIKKVQQILFEYSDKNQIEEGSNSSIIFGDSVDKIKFSDYEYNINYYKHDNYMFVERFVKKPGEKNEINELLIYKAKLGYFKFKKIFFEELANRINDNSTIRYVCKWIAKSYERVFIPKLIENINILESNKEVSSKDIDIMDPVLDLNKEAFKKEYDKFIENTYDKSNEKNLENTLNEIEECIEKSNTDNYIDFNIQTNIYR